MPTSRGPQALEAPSVSLVWIAPLLSLAYPCWLSRAWGRLALLKALPLPPWRLAVHIPNRSASRAPNRNKLKLFAVRRADYGPFRIVGDTVAPNQSLWTCIQTSSAVFFDR